MHDLENHPDNQAGALAAMGAALGAAGQSVEGGGAWEVAIAHFLFHDGAGARQALETGGISVVACREVVALRLKQEVLGQLGLLTGKLAVEGVNIEALYSDHDNQLILVVDEINAARLVIDLSRHAAQTNKAYARNCDFLHRRSASGVGDGAR